MSADLIGQGLDRSDGLAKVTGAAIYAAEFKLPALCHAVMVTSTIAKGAVQTIDDSAAQGVAGVLLVMTAQNVMRLPNNGRPPNEIPAGRTLSLLQDNEIHYNGEPIAVVVGETLEAAQLGARMLRVQYQKQAPALDFQLEKARAVTPTSMNGKKPDMARGDANEGLVGAASLVDASYSTPLEFHNPMEPHATIAHWEGDRLTLYDSTQGVEGVKKTAAKIFGIDAANVRCVCRFTGGGFGSKGSMWSHVMLTAMAAKTVQRPVKMSLERSQMFFQVGFRPETEQHLVLASDVGGRLTSMRHDAVSASSTLEEWVETCAVATRMLYACANQTTSHRVFRMNVGTPTFMRAPGEASGVFALECAMDELAYARGIDPVALRLANYTESDPSENKPFSGKALRQCYEQGAARFNWSRRNAVPRSMREGHALVGLGMATATYPANRQPAQAMARLNADGSILVRSATQDLGTGTYTIMTQIAAQTVGFPLRNVRFELGDSAFPNAPGSGGSTTAATVGPAVQDACIKLRQQIIEAAIGDEKSPLFNLRAQDLDIEDGWVLARSDRSRRDASAEIVGRRHGTPIEAQGAAQPGSEKQQYSMHSFGAVFVEVHVDEALGSIRLERVTGVYDVGRLLNEKTAHSQLMGGIIYGVGMALFEQGQLDQRFGRIVNNNLAEYHVPVNADIRQIDIAVIEGSDTIFNPLGARGIGEIGNTGIAAAIGNAVFHATGKRVRRLPITCDTLL